MRTVSTAGAVHLAGLMHRDPIAEVYSGRLVGSGAPVIVTLARQRSDGPPRDVFLDWGARLTRLSTHPHIAPIASVGLTETGRPYIAVETTRTTLADMLAESGPPPAGQVRALGVALADTLAQIHATGLIHGALQPSTVLSGPGRKLLVAGFDATAPALAHSLPPGPYTPPEHIDASLAGSIHASPAGDIYSLATMLYGALGGRLPWLGGHRGDAADPVLRAAPIPDIPGVSTALTDVLCQAMHPDPRSRPDAERFRDLLASLDTARPLAPGTTPADVHPAMLPQSGPRPTGLTGGADIAVPPRRRRRPRLRVARPVKIVASVALAMASVAGAGYATFAATSSEEWSCPSTRELTEELQQTYDDATVTDRVCTEDRYVAVTTEATEPQTAETLPEHLVLREVNGSWQLLSGCESDVPEKLRDYLDCD